LGRRGVELVVFRSRGIRGFALANYLLIPEMRKYGLPKESQPKRTFLKEIQILERHYLERDTNRPKGTPGKEIRIPRVLQERDLRGIT